MIRPNKETRLPSLPPDSDIGKLVPVLKQYIEVREGLRGDPLDANVTWRDLSTAGLASITYAPGSGGGNGPGGSTVTPPPAEEEAPPDLSPPPQPTGLVAFSAIVNIMLRWSTPPAYNNLAFSEVWRATSNDINAAVMVGTSQGVMYNDAVGPASVLYYYWVRFISKANVPGQFSVAISGSTTYIDHPQIADFAVISAKIGLLAVDTAQIAYGAITEAQIDDLAVTNAKIDNATITDAKIVELNAGKITAGTLRVATFVRSQNYVPGSTGFNINGAGQAEFYNVTARGDIRASSVVANMSISAPTINGGTVNTAVLNGGSIFTPTMTVANGVVNIGNGKIVANAVDGSVYADTVDIRRRIVLRNGQADPLDIIKGQYYTVSYDGQGNAYQDAWYYQSGAVFRGTCEVLVLTDIYDADTQNQSSNQPYYVAANFVGSLRSWTGQASTFLLQATGKPAPVKSFTNVGVNVDNSRLAISFDYTITLVSGSFTTFRLPVINWTLFKL